MLSAPPARPTSGSPSLMDWVTETTACRPEPQSRLDENTLPDVIIQLMKDVGAPRGVRELGYDEDDIDELVDGAMKQQRLLVGAPREVSEEDLANIIHESMENW